MRLAATIICVLIAMATSNTALSASLSTLQHREHRQTATLHRYTGTLLFFRHHAWLVRKPPTRPIALREIRRAQAWVSVLRRELAETRASLYRPVWPAHHALWMCIHGHEAADWHNPNTGGNGHWGGLQMHPGWGYGTSYYASNDSQLTQEQAAEAGYRASGFSRSWLMGQWFHPDCLRYA